MFINLTPHVLNVKKTDGTYLTIAPSGTVARVATSTVTLPPIDGVSVSSVLFGDVSDLPNPVDGVIYITSMLVAQAAKRADVLSPGSLIRDDSGQPVGCDGLSSSI